jgi:hypothetical protein
MNTRRRLALVARILFGLIAIALPFTFLSKGRFESDAARIPQAVQNTQAVPATMRLLENRVPQHLPVRVKLKREKENLFRDLDNDNWARDLELEVKNTGDQPIYFIFFYLLVPEAKIADSYQAFSIYYGRPALSDWTERPTSQDVPIKPGETVFLKIEETGVRGWDEARAAGKVPARITGSRLIFQDLSFGDGTGFEGTSGSPRSKREDTSSRSISVPIGNRRQETE